AWGAADGRVPKDGAEEWAWHVLGMQKGFNNGSKDSAQATREPAECAAAADGARARAPGRAAAAAGARAAGAAARLLHRLQRADRKTLNRPAPVAVRGGDAQRLSRGQHLHVVDRRAARRRS